MWKTTQPKTAESFGRGKITPFLVAFIVDQYLCDNNFPETRSTFRNEASSLFANSSINVVQKSMLSLAEMLDEYICLKEQKVMLDQQSVVVMQEKNQVQMLLQGMQNAIGVYNAFQRPPSSNFVVMNTDSVVVPQSRLYNKTSPGVSTINTGNFSTPMISVSNKRKDTQAVNVPTVAKKPRGRPPGKKIPVQGQNTLPPSSNAVNNQVVSRPSFATQSSNGNCAPSGSQIQGASVTKCLYNQPSFPVSANSPVSKTLPRTHSSHSDTYVSLPAISPVATCNGEATSSCYNVIPTKRVMVSPAKRIACIESSRCISPANTDSDKASERNHVRSRLDASDMHKSLDKSFHNEVSISESDKEVDISGIDCSNWEMNVKMLSDLGMHYEDIDFSDLPALTRCKDNASGSSHECNANQVTSELPSTPTEALKMT